MLKFLRINANQKTVIFEEVKEEYKLCGGRGLIAKLLNDEVDPACNALGPGNKLIICGGLLNGTVATTSGRLSFGGKSPLTGTAKEANVGGTGGG
ncbi:MAG TPA: aldehyde ferredoxin oxidoreductase, partial [Firmicutes bacterium]|nr:aldehyde ferredoxin oxidoreductase [Bacillota bacterium]